MPQFSNIIEFEDDGLFQDSRPYFIQAVHRMSHGNIITAIMTVQRTVMIMDWTLKIVFDIE